MADHPEGQQSITVDRTSALVASGLAVLAILGVVTVFSDAIAAVWSPSAPPPSIQAGTPAPFQAGTPAPFGAGGSS
jgi:hypothetical protein